MKRARSYDPTQQTFDYKRATKLNMLERMNVACGCRANGKRFCQCRLAVKGLLKAVDGFARDHSAFAVTIGRLAESMGASPSTVKRAIAKAVSLGYLLVTPGDGAKSPAPGRAKAGTRSTYEIQWLKIWNETEEGPENTSFRESEPPFRESEPPSKLTHGVAQIEPPVPPPTNTTNKYRPSSTQEDGRKRVVEKDDSSEEDKTTKAKRQLTTWQRSRPDRSRCPLTANELSNPAKIDEWIDAGTPGIPEPLKVHQLAGAVACGLEAQEDGRDPVALFLHKCVELQRTGIPSVRYGLYDAAKRRVRTWQETRPTVGHALDATAMVAASLADTS